MLALLLSSLLVALVQAAAGPEASAQMQYLLHDSYALLQLEGRACLGNIFAGYQQTIKMRVLKLENVKFLMVSSEMIEDCQEFNWIGCNPTDRYCRSYDSERLVAAVTSEEEIQVDPCLGEVYLHVVPLDPQAPSSLWTFASQGTSSCLPLERDPCSSQSYDRCRNLKDSNCGKVACTSDNRYLRGFCYSNVTRTRAVELCSTSSSWSRSETRDVEILVFQPSSGASLLTLVLLMVLSVGAAVCCCSIYYRYRLKTDGFPPFKPPAACPTCLFPVPQYMEDDYASINNGMIPLNILRSMHN